MVADDLFCYYFLLSLSLMKCGRTTSGALLRVRPDVVAALALRSARSLRLSAG